MDDGTPGFNAVLALKTARADKTLPPTSSVQLARNKWQGLDAAGGATLPDMDHTRPPSYRSRHCRGASDQGLPSAHSKQSSGSNIDASSP